MSTPDSTRALLAAAAEAYADDPAAAQAVKELQRRLDEPLRVAVAGKLKAGKSTLLNGLLGEEVAATDAGECTLVSTWYVHGATPSARLWLMDGRTVPLVLRRADGRLSLDLAGHRPEDVSRMEVTWPAPVLTEMTLIDTPGLGSLTEEASRRTVDLVTPTAGPGVDALIFLMRHRQADDLEVLEDFRRQSDPAAGSEDHPMNVIGVLSRADELGGGGLDALVRSLDMANSYANDPRVRPICQQVLPVAGLMAQGAETLRQAEFESLRTLAAMPKDRRELLMLSAHRFVTAVDPDVTPEARRALLDRLGLFGIRLAMVLLPYGHDDPTSLANELLRRSGLPKLKTAVVDTYAQGAELLKARSALTGLGRLLAAAPCPDPDLARRLEAILLAAHDLHELRLIARLRTAGLPGLNADEVKGALRLAGSYGDSPAERLGLPEPTAEAIGRAALKALGHWRQVAHDPLAVRALREGAETLARTCEAILATRTSPFPLARRDGSATAPRSDGPATAPLEASR